MAAARRGDGLEAQVLQQAGTANVPRIWQDEASALMQATESRTAFGN
jgi:hypothetical protein